MLHERSFQRILQRGRHSAVALPRHGVGAVDVEGVVPADYHPRRARSVDILEILHHEPAQRRPRALPRCEISGQQGRAACLDGVTAGVDGGCPAGAVGFTIVLCFVSGHALLVGVACIETPPK